MPEENTSSPAFDIIQEFINDLFTELAIDEKTAGYEQLKKVIEERVTARLFLELISILKPEQLERVQADLAGDQTNADGIFAQLLDEIPDLQLIMARILGKIRTELLVDLKVISNKAE